MTPVDVRDQVDVILEEGSGGYVAILTQRNEDAERSDVIIVAHRDEAVRLINALWQVAYGTPPGTWTHSAFEATEKI